MTGCEHNSKITSNEECCACAAFRAEMEEFWKQYHGWTEDYKTDITWVGICWRAEKHVSNTKHQVFFVNCYEGGGCTAYSTAKVRTMRMSR